MRSFWIGILASLAASSAFAGDQLETGAPAAWIRLYDAAKLASPHEDDGAAIRIELLDQQHRFDGGTWRQYVRLRRVVQSPQALPLLGSLVIPWNPAYQTVTIHEVRIIRNGVSIDALKDREFTILRREENLESAMLSGVLSATLQLDDLRVGDTLDLAYSTETRISVLGDHAEMLVSGNVGGLVERYRLRASWPTARRLNLRTTDGWDAPAVRRSGGDSEIEIDLTDLQPLLVPQDAPMRFHQVRQLELSDYAAWSDVADVFAPLYERASVLEADSPLHARIEEIRAAHPDAAGSAAAALRLVQDEVRYMALTMGEGGLTPASADETWRRRLGDCKAKTALLLALLRELGVPARPVLVSTNDDALDRRLPLVSVFDHIMVAAEVDGRTFWLDGTRSGDRQLISLPAPPYGWVLPVTSDAALVHIEQTPPVEPLKEIDLRLDASGGLYAPVPMTGVLLQRGDAAAFLQAQFALASAGQRDAYMRQTWTALVDDLEIAEVRSSYDRDANVFRMTATGTTKLDWLTSGSQRTEIPLSRISWAADEAREDGPYRDLPWSTAFPHFTRIRTTVTLPPDETFTLAGEDVSTEAANYAHSRRTILDAGVIVMEREVRSLAPEMTDAERAAAVDPLDRLRRKRAEIVIPADYAMTGQDADTLEAAPMETLDDMIERGLVLSRNGRTEEAIAAFDAAIAHDPDSANALANRGIVRFWSRDMPGAKADFDAAAAIDPTDGVVMNGLGLIALSERRFDEALVLFTELLARDEDDPFALRMRTATHAGLKDYDNALEDLHDLQAITPDDRSAFMQEVVLLTEAGRLQDAADAADAAATRWADDLDVLQVQAGAHERLGDYADAEAALDAALRIEADHAIIRLDRADIRAKKGDLDGARQDMAEVRPTAGDSFTLMNNLCWVQAVSGFDLDQALSDCDAALAIRPDNAAALDSRALVLLQLGRTDAALAAYDAALDKAPEQTASRYGRGLALRALGRADEGQVDIDAALAVSSRAGDDFRNYETRASGAAAP